MLGRLSLAALLFSVIACNAEPSFVGETPDETPAATTPVASTEVVASAEAACLTAPASNDESALVCHRWSCERDVTSAVAWNGNPAQCAAGSLDDETRLRALRIVNTYRFLAGVPEIKTEARWKNAAQDCALLAHANSKLDHQPPSNWSCWSDRGAHASAVSLIANRSAPIAVDAFMEDAGNETTMVHRRWLLDTHVERIAFGSTSKYSCITVDGKQFDKEEAAEDDDSDARGAKRKSGVPDAPATWVAWPPAGLVPIDALRATKVDTAGWTVQSQDLQLDHSKVEVTVDGEPKKVKVTELGAGEGSLSAIRFVPDGWSIEAGRRYEVVVRKGSALRLSFTVQPIGC
jgi:uncharacterized protein YkwD